MQIELQQIHKHFGKAHVLKGIDLKVDAGSIHGLVGENGAGKSTLMKILTGYLSRSGGRILLDGEEVECETPAAAAALGIGMLYQEPQDFPPLTVLDNFIVGRDTHPDNHRGRQQARLQNLADQVHFNLDGEAQLEQLTVGERQQLEFLRLLGRDARLLILDEPTTGISDRQKERLFAALHQIRDQGRTILLVSHKLEEVVALCDRVTILRHGEVSGEESAPFHIPRLLALMFDQSPATDAKPQRRAPGDALLWLRNLSASGERTGLHDCNCTIHQGEVVGLAGLSGSGQGLFLRLAAALVQPTAGEVEFHGRSLNRRDHRTMRRLGGCFLPANRLEEGLIAGFTLVDHFTLALRCSRREARAAAERAIDKFRIRGTPDSTADSLSGGNQQRLLLSLIPTGANMVLLENPTRGLDVESAGWVWRYLRKHYAGQGAIVFSSAELDEILAVADRVLVFFDGRVVRDLPMDRVDYQDVAAAMTGN
ncbi:MAG: ATP-binding cassette domain-containing protein [Gammaproteobacteria bacterium]|nr:ATP-binding cassette domain-containing protein [Gammaproteobacteria bacterium]